MVLFTSLRFAKAFPSSQAVSFVTKAKTFSSSSLSSSSSSFGNAFRVNNVSLSSGSFLTSSLMRYSTLSSAHGRSALRVLNNITQKYVHKASLPNSIVKMHKHAYRSFSSSTSEAVANAGMCLYLVSACAPIRDSAKSATYHTGLA